MRGVFDDEEIHSSRQHADTELTLGSGTLLAIFFGLVLLCGLCFGMGYALGHRGSGPTAITAPRPAPDQEPLQASSGIPKPSAIAQTPVAPLAAADGTNPAGSGGAPVEETGSEASPGEQVAQNAPTAPAANTAATAGGAPQVHPALMTNGAAQPGAYAPAQAVHPAIAQPPVMVQIAAVSNPEDAEVLVNALRKRNYPVTAHRDPADNFIHVRIGPFATRAIAEQWKNKLLNDGYNAVVQP
jgi:DedD protein